MDLIAKVNSYEKLDDYIKMGANAFLFGIKDFSINSLTKLKIKDLKNYTYYQLPKQETRAL